MQKPTTTKEYQMNDPRQMYLFNYMEYDDYDSNDWDDILFDLYDKELEYEYNLNTQSEIDD